MRDMLNPKALANNPNLRRDLSDSEVEGAASRLSSQITTYAINEAIINDLAMKRETLDQAYLRVANETADDVIANGRSFRIHNDQGGFWDARYSKVDGQWYIQGTGESIGEQGVRDNLAFKLGPGKMPGKDYSLWNVTKWGTGDAGTADYIETYDFSPGDLIMTRNVKRIGLDAQNDLAERVEVDNALLMTAPKENFSLAREGNWSWRKS